MTYAVCIRRVHGLRAALDSLDPRPTPLHRTGQQCDRRAMVEHVRNESWPARKLSLSIAAVIGGLAVALSGAMGCGTGAGTRAENGSSGSASAQVSCEQRSGELESWLADFRRDGLSHPYNGASHYRQWSAGTDVVELSGATEPYDIRGNLAEILPGTVPPILGDEPLPAVDVKFNNKRMGAADLEGLRTAASLYARLIHERELYQRAQRNQLDLPVELVEPTIAVTPDSPWSSVVWLVEVFEHFGFQRVRFLFRKPAHAATPAPTDRFKQRDGWQYGYGISALDNGLLADMTGDCPQVGTLFEELRPKELAQRNQAPLMRADGILDRLPGAARACDCRVKFEEVRLMLSALAARPTDHLLGVVTVTLAPRDADAPALVAEPDLPWKKAATLVVEHSRERGATPVHFQLKSGESDARVQLAALEAELTRSEAEREAARQRLKDANRKLEQLRSKVKKKRTQKKKK